MLCKHCKEQIEQGEATEWVPVPGNTQHKWYFHVGHLKLWDEAEKARRLELVAHNARTVH